MVHSFIKEGSSTRITEIISLIQEDDDEVTLAIVNILLRHPSALNLVGNNTSLLKTILWQKAVSDSSWEQVRIACMQLLHVVLGRYPEDTLIDIDCWLLLDLIQRPRTLPLKEAALVVLGKMMHHIFLSDLDNRWQLLSAWMEQVHATSYEEMVCLTKPKCIDSVLTIYQSPILVERLPFALWWKWLQYSTCLYHVNKNFFFPFICHCIDSSMMMRRRYETWHLCFLRRKFFIWTTI